MARGNMTYQTRTDSDLKSAFLKILEKKPLSDMTIAEVVREAHISRSTFYLHYQNLGELYDEMVREVACQVLPLLTRCGCNCEPEKGKQPFCHIVREANQYTPPFPRDAISGNYPSERGGGRAKCAHRETDGQRARRAAGQSDIRLPNERLLRRKLDARREQCRLGEDSRNARPLHSRRARCP